MLSDDDLLAISRSSDQAAIIQLTPSELDRLKDIASRTIRAAAPAAALVRIQQLTDPDQSGPAASDILDRSGIGRKNTEDPNIILSLPEPIMLAITETFRHLVMRNVTPDKPFISDGA